jgi:hypothetical protein
MPVFGPHLRHYPRSWLSGSCPRTGDAGTDSAAPPCAAADSHTSANIHPPLIEQITVYFHTQHFLFFAIVICFVVVLFCCWFFVRPYFICLCCCLLLCLCCLFFLACFFWHLTLYYILISPGGFFITHT